MKSWQIARGLLFRGSIEEQIILCTREYQNSIADSVHSVLEQQAAVIGIKPFYDFKKTYIKGRNGTEIIFKGLQKIDSVKSLEGAGLVWNEEATRTSKTSISKLYPTVRKKGAQIITSFNPEFETDPIFVQHVTNHNPKSQYLCKVNYTDNPWIDEEWVARALELRDSDYDEYAHVYLGECWTRSDAQIFNGKWEVREFDMPEAGELVEFFDGLDFGFAQDPTFGVKCWVVSDEKPGGRIMNGRLIQTTVPQDLYIGYEMSQVELDIADTKQTLVNAIPGITRAKIRADSARPETISHLKREGLDIEGVEKWKGSVEDGITVIRNFRRIYIHPRCKNMIQEAIMYRYKVDKLTEKVLPVIVDKHNHGWDAVRYALAPLIKQRRKGLFG